ncbi:hypothetical protein ISN45_Aa03g016540 [Arabidopsis thaliana x Arabidopsis arenosa]|uniref:Uncharacterized protein n=1 Tax=Arabidopsis thaliana x Arabidopsis arenosa TaxID=1240361 RepID=A0A8T2ATB6_9BRAS|nr:hypothetical protein ISN45_Aa03g016540 [Arabidopsis thaliana x Arabidopsis arenosa]
MDFVRRAVMVFGSDLWKRICSDSATKGLAKALQSSPIASSARSETPLGYARYCTIHAVLIGDCKVRRVSPVWNGTRRIHRVFAVARD